MVGEPAGEGVRVVKRVMHAMSKMRSWEFSDAGYFGGGGEIVCGSVGILTVFLIGA